MSTRPSDQSAEQHILLTEQIPLSLLIRPLISWTVEGPTSAVTSKLAKATVHLREATLETDPVSAATTGNIIF